MVNTVVSLVLHANSFDEVLLGNICPYCGQLNKNLLEHIEKCPQAKYNQDIAQAASVDEAGSRWATHDKCGKVLVIGRHKGLCLIETDSGRYVVPISALKFGMLSKIIHMIEEADLAEEEIEQLINILCIQGKIFKYVPPQCTQLWPGTRVEVQLGALIKLATIQELNGKNSYLALIDGTRNKVNITSKHILRLV